MAKKKEKKPLKVGRFNDEGSMDVRKWVEKTMV